MVYFRKRLTPEILGEINEMIIRDAKKKEEDDDSDDTDGNGGTLSPIKHQLSARCHAAQ